MTDYADLLNIETDPLNLEGAIALFRDHQAFKRDWYNDKKWNHINFSHLADREGVMEKIDEVLARLPANDGFLIFIDSPDLKIKTLIEMERFGQVTSFLLERAMDLPYGARHQVVSKINDLVKPAIRKYKLYPEEVLNFYRLADTLELSVSSDVCGEALRFAEYGLNAANWMGLAEWLKARELSRVMYHKDGLKLESQPEKVDKTVHDFLDGEWKMADKDFLRVKTFCDEFVSPDLLKGFLEELDREGDLKSLRLAEFLG